MTGLPCSGKTTIARNLQEACGIIGIELKVFDGDEIRAHHHRNNFSREAINENNRLVATKAKLMSNHVCVSLISPFKENREDARKIIGRDRFIEVYIKCSPSVCEERDVKGMYKKARRNEIKDFIGVHTDYEIPDKPDLVVNTETNSLDECADRIMDWLVDYDD